ncbi:MAG TPA: hypothetical protein DCZ75_04380 [Geobacter sp.]|nr:hypothetical protein [Geobacter sp.]
MPLKNNTIFYDILNIYPPWVISSLSYSKHRLRIDFRIDYDRAVAQCPICGFEAKVIGKTHVSWKHLDLFQFKTHMRAYLPITGNYNPGCRASCDQLLINNTLLLDLIVMQLKDTQVLNPLHVLFMANGLYKKWNADKHATH